MNSAHYSKVMSGVTHTNIIRAKEWHKIMQDRDRYPTSIGQSFSFIKLRGLDQSSPTSDVNTVVSTSKKLKTQNLNNQHVLTRVSKYMLMLH